MTKSPRTTINEKLTVVVGDIHFGEHDRRAVLAVDKVIEYLRPWRVVQLGDLRDFAPFSSHLPSGMFRDYDWERQETKPAEDWAKRQLTYCSKLILLGGNHEHRAERWAAGAGPAGEAVWELINPARIANVAEKGRIEYIPYANDRDITSRYHIAPNLVAIHGWTHAKNAAQIHLARASMAGWSVVYGHTHRDQSDTVRCPRTNSPLIAWSPACLRTFSPKWTQPNGPTGWTHAVTLIYQSQSNPRDWTHYNPQIIRGRLVLPDGHEIRA